MERAGEYRTLDDIAAVIAQADGAASYSELGEHNRVIFAEVGGAPASIKIPRDGGWGRSVAREALVAAIAWDFRATAPIETPRIMDYSEAAPRYLAYHYVSGEYLSVGDVQRLSPDEQRQLGRTMADFVVWLGSSVTIDEFPEIAEHVKTPNFSSWRVNLLQSRIIQQRAITTPLVLREALYEAATETLEMDCERPDVPDTLFGHGDLRSDNMLFRKAAGRTSLGAVLDFGVAELSSPEYELRHAPLMHTNVADAVLRRYREITGNALDESLMTHWARVQVLSATYNYVCQGTPIAPSRVQALQNVFPDIDFTEGLPLSQQGLYSVQ